jgi:hypothetical protein
LDDKKQEIKSAKRSARAGERSDDANDQGAVAEQIQQASQCA